MGLCASTAGEAASPRKPTALVLLPTDELREYPRQATAARALEDAAGGPWLLCDADAMGLEGPVPAVRGGEELRAGRIYFALPAAAARRGMRREEVAALAVRASVALSARAAAGKRWRGAVAPPSEDASAATRRNKRRAHRPPPFVSDLAAISE
jgi:hypothetical protein